MLFRQSPLYLLSCDAVAQHTIQEAGIEVIAGTDGADRFHRFNGILFAETAVCAYFHGVSGLREDEITGVEHDVRTIDFVGIAFLEEYLEVL